MGGKCVAGCVLFDGGERRHHVDCPFYPESMTKILHDVEAENKRLRTALDAAIEIISIGLKQEKAHEEIQGD